VGEIFSRERERAGVVWLVARRPRKRSVRTDGLPEESYRSSIGMAVRGNVNVEDSSSDFLPLITADCPLPDPNPIVTGVPTRE